MSDEPTREELKKLLAQDDPEATKTRLAIDMLERKAQKIKQEMKSDHISESTIARIAGNLLSGHHDALVDGFLRDVVVGKAVKTARLIAAEVRRTAPTAHEPDERKEGA